MIFIVFFSLLFLNEVSRRNKWVSIALYIVMPILLAIFVWPKALDSDSTSGNWFAWNKGMDMIWPDQLWFWIIAYDIWNIAYVYNCISDRSMYAGVIILTAATVASVIFKRGAWLQHRAQILALWGMFTLTFPDYASSPWFNIKSTHNPYAYMLLSSLALIIGISVLIYTYTRAFKLKKNPFTNDVFTDLDYYKKNIIEESIKS